MKNKIFIFIFLIFILLFCSFQENNVLSNEEEKMFSYINSVLKDKEAINFLKIIKENYKQSLITVEILTKQLEKNNEMLKNISAVFEEKNNLIATQEKKIKEQEKLIKEYESKIEVLTQEKNLLINQIEKINEELKEINKTLKKEENKHSLYFFVSTPFSTLIPQGVFFNIGYGFQNYFIGGGINYIYPNQFYYQLFYGFFINL